MALPPPADEVQLRPSLPLLMAVAAGDPGVAGQVVTAAVSWVPVGYNGPPEQVPPEPP